MQLILSPVIISDTFGAMFSFWIMQLLVSNVFRIRQIQIAAQKSYTLSFDKVAC